MYEFRGGTESLLNNFQLVGCRSRMCSWLLVNCIIDAIHSALPLSLSIFHRLGAWPQWARVTAVCQVSEDIAA
eukprot:scaffold10661_cov90-Cylindrotheca_fusiformis.AAC.1